MILPNVNTVKTTPPMTALRILVVDDDAMIGELLGEMLVTPVIDFDGKF